MSQKNDVKNAAIILKKAKKEGMSNEIKHSVLWKETNWTDEKIHRILTRMEKEQE